MDFKGSKKIVDPLWKKGGVLREISPLLIDKIL